MEQVIEKSALTDIEKVRAFVEFSIKNPYYNNALEKLNMGENSISQLLAWLLDTKWVNEPRYDITENQIHREFTYEFLKLIKSKESASESSILKTLEDSQLKELANGIVASQDKDNIDILLVNEDKKFVCVIENKKRAKLSRSANKEHKQVLQIEKYYEYINEKYKDYDKKFVYLCAEKDDVQKTITERIVDIGQVPQYIQDNLVFQGLSYNNFKDNKISWALEKLKYTVLEHNEVVLILYNILREKCPKAFDENGILLPLSESDMLNLATKLLQFFTRKHETENNTLKISGNAKIRFYDCLSEKFNYEERLELLCQYVEYWESHNDTTGLGDNLYGYSKIVDGEYIYNICKNAKNDKEKWTDILILAKNSERLQELITYI